MGTLGARIVRAHRKISPDGDQPACRVGRGGNEYPDQLGIALLTDCITMDAFLRDFGGRFASRYQGFTPTQETLCAMGRKACPL